MLHLIFSAFGAELGNGNTRFIIYDQIGIADDICPFYKFCPLFVLQVASTDILGIHFGLQGQQTVHQLLLGHLQTEHCYGHIVVKRHILGNVQNKSRLTHRRSRRHQDQIRRLKSGSLIIQINKTCRDSRNTSLISGSLFDLLYGIQHHVPRFWIRSKIFFSVTSRISWVFSCPR